MKKIMEKIKRSAVSILLVIIHLCFFHRLEAAAGFMVDAGYRYDRIDEIVGIYTIQPSAIFGIGSQQFKNLSSYQLGGQGFWNVCRSFVIKGCGHYGWITSGTYNYLDLVKGQLKGYTGDISAGIGYQVCISPSCKFIPFIGYGYDVQKVHIRASAVNEALVPVNGINGANWRTYFYAPWIGGDLNFASTCWCIPLQLNAGYEFHYGWANKQYEQINSLVSGYYSYSSHLKHMIGNVFRLQALYPFCRCWVAGIKLQYSQWHNAAIQMDKIPGPSSTGLGAGVVQKNQHLRWFSFAASFNIGYEF